MRFLAIFDFFIVHLRTKCPNKVNTLDKYSVDYLGLGEGSHTLTFDLDGELFKVLESNEVKDAACEANVTLNIAKRSISAHIDITGKVTVECDRCLEDCIIPIQFNGDLDITIADTEGEYDGEHMTIAHGNNLNLAQYLYESVVISLPIRRVHPEGECNEDMLARFTKAEE